MTSSSPRPLYEIARDVRHDWLPYPPNHVRPYLEAMANLEVVTDMYYHDSGRDIIIRFLANAGTWRGEVARRIKKELFTLLKEFKNDTR